VAVINKHNAIPDGAELRLRLGVFPTNQRSKVEEKISENERYAQVAWITNARSNQCLRWAFDGQNYSPSRLVREMLRDLGFGAGEKQGTLYWELPSGQSLVELADNYRQDDE
jgi:hypothetical protein